MSVDNFDSNGLADQPSIIYGFDGGDEIRELSRSGYGEPGPSPGDVIERTSTKSTLSAQLPELELPGSRGLKEDDCGEDIPVFACTSDQGCGNPVYVGRSCASPVCERDWPAAVKDKTTRLAGNLEAFRKLLNGRYNYRKQFDFNHVIASLPSFLVDSEQPYERALLILKTLLEERWGIEGFAAIYHPYRIKKEYRKDQYEHGGEEGEGDMTWKDVLSSDNPEQYIKFEPHFHLFFPAPRASFDYSVAESVQKNTGWVFHRVEKSGEDNHTSVTDLDDLVHQITYCFSHAGVNEWNADRSELTSRMKGDLHNVSYVPEEVKDEVLAIFCDAAPKLLGTRFTNLSEATCGAEVSATSSSGSSDLTDSIPSAECDQCAGPKESHPLHDVWDSDGAVSTVDGGDGDPWTDSALDVGTVDESDSGSTGDWVDDSSSDPSLVSAAHSTTPEGSVSGPSASSRDVSGDMETDMQTTCGGELRPISEATDRLEDQSWCQQAEYVSGLRTAVEEWKRRTGGSEDLPWIDEDEKPVVPDK